jgi:hypothetical protein
VDEADSEFIISISNGKRRSEYDTVVMSTTDTFDITHRVIELCKTPEANGKGGFLDSFSNIMPLPLH